MSAKLGVGTEDQAIEAVIALAKRAAQRGWTPATSGNFSARVDGARAAVTLSGRDKGALEPRDVLVTPIEGKRDPRVSAEAPLHYAIYRLFDDAGAIAHVHSRSATLASLKLAKGDAVKIEGLELLKALSGVTTHETTVNVPVFANDQDTDRLAVRVSQRLAAMTKAWGFLLAGHGLYVWGKTGDDAFRHLEALDFLFNLLLDLKDPGP
jgi:methylthioribulose-1-phosphate dehydratase